MRIPGLFTKSLPLFFVLFILIFLGEAKQSPVDVVGAGGIVVIVLYAKYYLEKKRELSDIQTITWAGLLLYLAVRSIFSDDIGYSVYTTVRYIEAFLIYRTFYCYFDQIDIAPFVHQLLGFCVISLVAAVVLTCFPFLQNSIPHMNLLYPAYGHNHIVDILLFGFPIVIMLAINISKNQYKTLAILLLIGIIFSMSRAAMTLVGVFIILLFSIHVITKKINQRYILFLTLLGLIAIGIIATWGLAENNFFTHAGIMLRKSSVFIDSRYGYYQQAIAAIQERPLFGSGPGTFYLQSLRLQRLPQTYSWFAHNFYLEQLVELGVVGCAALLFVFGTIAGHMLRAFKARRSNIYSIALVIGVGISLIYGFFDISLNFLVIWLLCWACLGAIGAADASVRVKKGSGITSVISAVFLILIGVFYCIVILTYIVPNGLYTGFLDVYYAVDLIKNENNANLISAAVLLHRKNPDVLVAAKKFKEAYLNNPQDTTLFQKYYQFLVKNDNASELTETVRGLISTTMSDPVLANTVLGNINPVTISALNTEQGVSFFGTPRNMKEAVSKMLYYAGLHMISQDPHTTGIFWEAANKITPELGHYYVELSSLYYFQSDEVKAKQVLIDCQQFRYPKKQCELAPWPPLAPGSLEDKIQAFPNGL